MTLPSKRSSWGYWISPEGDVHPLHGQRHLDFARAYLGKTGGGEGPLNDDWRVELCEMGWTRVAVHGGKFVAQLPPVAVDDRALAALDELVRQAHQERRLPIRIDDTFSGLCAGGATVRPGDPAVMRAWNGLRRARSASLKGPLDSL